MKFGWQWLHSEYAQQFSIKAPSWPPNVAQSWGCLPLCWEARLFACGNHFGEAKHLSGIGLKLFAFISESARTRRGNAVAAALSLQLTEMQRGKLTSGRRGKRGGPNTRRLLAYTKTALFPV